MTYTDIDIETATVDDIKSEIERLRNISNDCKNEEQAIKLVINSCYGSLANKWLICFNAEVAETITLQGQHLIKYAEDRLNSYFNDFWHNDTELHKKMGITCEVKPIKRPTVIYMDTDSCYVAFEEVLESCGWTGDEKDFILQVNEHRLTNYLNTCFDKYAQRWNTDNHMDFELENISETGIWLAKKKYILDEVWGSGISTASLSSIIFKGVELAQSSTPAFAREKLKELVKYIFTKKKKLSKNDLITLLRTIKDEFKMADPEKISMGRSINDYGKYILNDTTAFEMGKQTPIHVRASGYYNFVLNQDSKYKAKYQMIRAGDKVKFYYAKAKNKNAEENVFAYLAGSYPYEFAPAIDYDEQFSKTILDPINRIVVSMGNSPILAGLQRLTNVHDVDLTVDDDLEDFDPFA